MSKLGFKHSEETKQKIREMALKREKRPKGIWKTEAPSLSSTRRRSKWLLREIKCCQECISTRILEVHHIDGNPFNNKLTNLVKLCKACHIKKHPKVKFLCKVCLGKHKARGYCEKHYLRFKKWGNPLMVGKILSTLLFKHPNKPGVVNPYLLFLF